MYRKTYSIVNLMSVDCVEARVLDNLRPIFPQLNDRVLSMCIRNVQETVGSDPATITRLCVELLLSDENIKDQELNEVNDSQRFATRTTRLQEHQNVYNYPFVNDHDDVDDYDVSSDSPFFLPGFLIGYNTEVRTPSILKTATPSLPSQNARKTVRDPRRDLSFKMETAPTVARSPSSINMVRNVQDPAEKEVPGNEAPTVFVEPRKEQALKTLNSIFPDAEEDHLQDLFMKCHDIDPNEAMHLVCNELLDKRGEYPRKSTTQLGSITSRGCSRNEPPNGLGLEQGREREGEIDPSTQSSTRNCVVAIEPLCEQLAKKDKAQIENDYMEDFSCVSEQRYWFPQSGTQIIRQTVGSRKNGHFVSHERCLQQVSGTATSTSTSAPQDIRALPSTAETNSIDDDLGFSKPPLLQERDRMLAEPAKKALEDIPCHKQPEASKELQSSSAVGNKRGLPKDSMQSTAFVKVARTCTGSKTQEPKQDMQSIITAKEMTPPGTISPGSKTREPDQDMQSIVTAKEMTPSATISPGTCIKKGIPSDDDLEKLSNYIAEHWMPLGRRLQIGQHKLNELSHRWSALNAQAFHMLVFWKQKYSSAATYLVLSAALCHEFVNRRDLAEKICFHKESSA